MKKGLIVGAATFATVLVAGYFVADHIANARVREQAEIFARDMRQWTREFRYGEVRADLLGRAIVMSKVEFVTLDGDRIRAESVSVRDFDWRSRGTPRYADFVITRAEVPSSALNSLAKASGSLGPLVGVSAVPPGNAQRLLDRAGYRRTTSDIYVHYRYDDATRELEIRDVQLEIADLGKVVFNLKLGNVPAEGVRPEEALLTATQMTLVRASLAFRDRSLVSRLLKAYSADRNISEAEALERVLADLRAERDRSRDAVEREGLEALIRFVERPGEIRLALEPERPVPLLGTISRFFGSRAFKQTFGLTITAR